MSRHGPIPTGIATAPCHACAGRFGLGYHEGTPVAYHTTPYCSAFNAIVSTEDAIRFSQKCRRRGPPS